MHDHLGEVPDADGSSIVVVSARSGDGINELHAVLSRFLRTRKLQETLLGVLWRSETVANRLAVLFEARSRAASDPDRANSRQAITHREIERLSAEERSIAARIRAILPRDFARAMDATVAAHCEAAVAAGQTFTQWLDERREDLSRTLSTLASPHIDTLSRVLSEVDRVAERVAGIDEDNDRGVAPLAVVDVPVDVWPAGNPLPSLDWRAPVQTVWSTLPGFRSRMRRLIDESRGGAIAKYREVILAKLVTCVEDWVGQMLFGFEQKFAAAAAAADAAMALPLATERVAELASARTRLEQIRGRIEAAANGKIRSGRPARDRARFRIRRCAFCERTRESVFTFLAKEQYELHVSESRRKAYVKHGGFCALHLWQFGKIASPQGICVAYAPVLADIGRRLAASTNCSTVEAVQDAARRIGPTQASCPACQVVRATEETLLSRSDVRTGSLCLPHFGLVLGRTHDVVAARRLVAEQAQMFERIAVDMQNYALKFDAMKRSLLTESEDVAFARGLAAIAAEKGVRSTIVDQEE
jgi:DNA-binding phage protein